MRIRTIVKLIVLVSVCLFFISYGVDIGDERAIKADTEIKTQTENFSEFIGERVELLKYHFSNYSEDVVEATSESISELKKLKENN